eukprot:c39681_g1_i1 orf=24-242(-)
MFEILAMSAFGKLNQPTLLHVLLIGLLQMMQKDEKYFNAGMEWTVEKRIQRSPVPNIKSFHIKHECATARLT